MGNTRRERQGVIFYHQLIQFAGILAYLASPIICVKFYFEKEDMLSAIILLILLWAFVLYTLTPYIFSHRFKSEGVHLGGEIFRWESISSVQKTDNELVIHSKNNTQAVLKTPFKFLKTDEPWRVMTEIYPPLSEKLTD